MVIVLLNDEKGIEEAIVIVSGIAIMNIHRETSTYRVLESGS